MHVCVPMCVYVYALDVCYTTGMMYVMSNCLCLVSRVLCPVSRVLCPVSCVLCPVSAHTVKYSGSGVLKREAELCQHHHLLTANALDLLSTLINNDGELIADHVRVCVCVCVCVL